MASRMSKLNYICQKKNLRMNIGYEDREDRGWKCEITVQGRDIDGSRLWSK